MPCGTGRVSLGEVAPRVDQGAWVAPGSTLVGEVHVQTGASVWYGVVIRADCARVVVGEQSNI